jgi:ABC-type transport system involved in multi-copper enzyme maturation permease subunit
MMSGFSAAFMWHLRRDRVRMAVLGLAAASFVALVLGLSDSIRPIDVQELLESLPPALRALMGMNEGVTFNVSRWVGLVYNHPVWLIAILGFPLASGLRGVAGGIDDGTAELVLAQPLGRSTYYLALAAVVALGTTLVLACSMLGGLIARHFITLPDVLPTSILLELSASGWALGLSVAGISLLISVVSAGGGRPGSAAIGIVVGMFFIRFLADVVPGASWLRWFSVFGYHNPDQVAAEGLAAGPFLALLAVGLVCGGIGLWAFKRKQLTF